VWETLGAARGSGDTARSRGAMTTSRRTSLLLRCGALVAPALLVLAAGCKTGAYVWVDGVPKTMLLADTSSDIHAGDVIGIRVWNQDANSNTS